MLSTTLPERKHVKNVWETDNGIESTLPTTETILGTNNGQEHGGITQAGLSSGKFLQTGIFVAAIFGSIILGLSIAVSFITLVRRRKRKFEQHSKGKYEELEEEHFVVEDSDSDLESYV